MQTPPTPAQTAYDLIGGEAGVHRLVDRFYQLMDELPEAFAVRKIHPESLEGSNALLFEFLSGWLGGPPLYEQKKGHPMLRRRHLPYVIGPVERDQWMLCMRQALEEQGLESGCKARLTQAFSEMAERMVNTD
jgi:hemoglobin